MLLSKLFSKLRRKLWKKKEPKKTVFGEVIEEVKVESTGEKIKKKLRSLSFPKKRYRVKIGAFLRIKRLIAGVLFVIYVFASIFLFPHPAMIFFVLTAFIILDYILKTRIMRWVKDEK